MVAITPLLRRLTFGAAVFAAFALFGVTGWIELARSSPVKMILREASVLETYARRGGRGARIDVSASYLLDGEVHYCKRAFLFEQMTTTEASAPRIVGELAAVRHYDGRAIRGEGERACWLVTDWKYPAAIASLGFFLGFFLVRPRKEQGYEILYGKR